MLLYPWDSPGKNTGVGSHSLLQGIFLPQESNPGLLHCRQIFTYWVMSEAHVYMTMCIYCKMITMVSLVNLHLTYRCFFHCDKIICLTTFKYRAHITHHAVPCILGASQVALVVQCRRCKRHGFDPWVGRIPWRRAWQPSPVFLPRESWWEELGGLQSTGSQRVRPAEET